MRASSPKLFSTWILHLSLTPRPRNTTANLAVGSVAAYFVTIVTQPSLVTQKEPSPRPTVNTCEKKIHRKVFSFDLFCYDREQSHSKFQICILVFVCGSKEN